MDAYTECFIHMPGVYVYNPFIIYVDVYDKCACVYGGCEVV